MCTRKGWLGLWWYVNILMSKIWCCLKHDNLLYLLFLLFWVFLIIFSSNMWLNPPTEAYVCESSPFSSLSSVMAELGEYCECVSPSVDKVNSWLRTEIHNFFWVNSISVIQCFQNISVFTNSKINTWRLF